MSPPGTTEGPEADVIQLRPDEEATDHDAPLTRREQEKREPQFCNHRRITLDTEARRVYCRDCDVERPAFDVLVGYSGNWEDFVRRRKHATRQAREAEERLLDLERRVRNAKARVRKWGARSGEAAERALADVLAQCAHAGTDPKVKRFAEHVAWYARRGVRE